MRWIEFSMFMTVNQSFSYNMPPISLIIILFNDETRITGFTNLDGTGLVECRPNMISVNLF